MFARDCTFGRVGAGEGRGLDALREARLELASTVGGCTMVADSVVGEGQSVALLVSVGSATHVTRGTIVITLDDDDLIISERTYLDWNRAVSRHELSPRPWVGTAAWTRPE